ncbi:MAG: iron-containing alcohol dehydrogenase [Clostridia bacterium]|nr:iron-containing alcohol dehydrogenase [Clostridia bacterium]
MAISKKKLVRYTRISDVDPQSLYLEEDARLHLVDEFKAMGTRRILIVCDNSTRRLKPFEELLECFDDEGFRVFIYCQTGNMLIDRDIEGGVKIYHEYNCDTIVVIGGTSEIDCAKLIAACVNNPVKSLSQLVGTNRLVNDIPPICSIMTENCASSTTASAEFFDSESKQWKTVLSGYLIPHMVVIDTDFSDRVTREVTISSALTALCIAIEAYISPQSKEFKEYRASAPIACSIIYKNLEKYCNNATDAFLRKQIAVGGFYAGLSARKTGIGYAHIIMHVLINHYGIVHGTGFPKLLALVLQAQLDNEETCEALAEIAKISHFCSQNLENKRAAESLIDNLNRITKKCVGEDNPFSIVDKTKIEKVVEDIEKETKFYDLKRDIDTRTLYSIISALS